MGPRIGAWIVDFLIYVALGLFLGPTPLSPLAEYHEVPDTLDYGEACDQLGEDDDVFGCLQIGDRAYVTEASDAAIQLVVTLTYVGLVFVLWQGMSGKTPGKALLGLTTVGADGRPPGPGKALVRTLLWVVDGAPWCFPLVGLITGMTSTGHRRVGDMAAKTFVIRNANVGRPVMVPGMTPSYAQPGYGAPTTYPGPGGYPPAPGAGPWGGAPQGPPGGPAQGPSAPPLAPQPSQWGAPPGPAGPPPAEQRPAPPADRPMPPTPGVEAPAGFPEAGFGAAPRPVPGGEAPSEPERPSEESPFGVGGVGAGPEAERGEVPSFPPVAPTDEAGGPAVAEPAPAAEAEAEVAEIEAEIEAEGAAADETPAESAAPTETPAEEAPAAEPVAGEAAPAEAAAAQAPTYNPQWDAARGTYIQWDPNRGRWLAWDDTAKQWNPI